MKDSLMAITADLDEVFCFNYDATYQDRAHDYLVRHEVGRSGRDTAVQRVVHHLVQRTVDVTRADPELRITECRNGSYTVTDVRFRPVGMVADGR